MKRRDFIKLPALLGIVSVFPAKASVEPYLSYDHLPEYSAELTYVDGKNKKSIEFSYEFGGSRWWTAIDSRETPRTIAKANDYVNRTMARRAKELGIDYIEVDFFSKVQPYTKYYTKKNGESVCYKIL